MNQDMNENFSQFAELFKTFVPTVNPSRNGFEIRTQVLETAKSFAEFEYSMKIHNLELSSRKDSETGEIVGTVNWPEVPGVEQVLENARRFYEFVENRNYRT